MSKHLALNLTSIGNWPELAAAVHYRASLLARRLNVSRRKLERDFRRQLQTTPQQHLNAFRAVKIKDLIIQNKRTKDIRLAVFYKQDTQVCRRFLSAFGGSIKDFRRKI